MTDQTNKSEAKGLRFCKNQVKNNTQHEHWPHCVVNGKTVITGKLKVKGKLQSGDACELRVLQIALHFL